MSEKKCVRKCINCRHRIVDDKYLSSKCEIDGHYVGYLECFGGWCKHWAKDKFMCGESENKTEASENKTDT